MSAKQLFYEGIIMAFQSFLNDILSVSQVDLFWKAWPWQSDTACVTAQFHVYCWNRWMLAIQQKLFYRFQSILGIDLCGNKHIYKTVQTFIAMPVVFKQNLVYTLLLLPYCFLNPMALLHNGYVKHESDQTLSVGHPLNQHRKLFFFFLNLCFLKIQKK